MSFPQTTPTGAIRDGQQIWRLSTQLESSGDIYESEVAAEALVIGPDSDVARVQATYYDGQNANLANTVSISASKPYIGRLDVFASKQYTSGDQARLLLSIIDLLPPPGFRPPSAGVADVIELIPPYLDLLSYLNGAPSYIPPRADKTYLFEQVPNHLSANPQWFLVPFYGRRFAEITCKSLGFVNQPVVDVSIYGVNFSNNIVSSGLADNGHQEELLSTMAFPVPGLGSGITDSRVVSNRAFDYLAIKLDTGGIAFPDVISFPVRISMSDEI